MAHSTVGSCDYTPVSGVWEFTVPPLNGTDDMAAILDSVWCVCMCVYVCMCVCVYVCERAGAQRIRSRAHMHAQTEIA